MKLTRLISTLPLLAIAGTLAAQPVQGPNGNYYELITTTATWDDARVAAEGMMLAGATGHLATLTTAEEDAFVAGFAAGPDAYFGASDAAVEGTWEWVTGEAWSYTNWNTGEPNDSGGEDCIHFLAGTTWNDISCSGLRPYVVEWEAADFVPQTNTFATEVYPTDAGTPEMTITCNAGLPLSQSGSAGTTFSVTELPVGAECTVSLSGELEEGFQLASYACGPVGVTEADGCTFTIDPAITAFTTTVYAEPIPVDFEVTVDWNISPEADVGVGDYAYVELYCGDLWAKPGYSSTTLDADPDADMPLVLTNLQPDPGGDSYCYAYLYGTGSAVEIESDCSNVDLDLGTNASCTITATAFYEGVPTLSQYGMAIMALLMLGAGFIGFRRFV